MSIFKNLFFFIVIYLIQLPSFHETAKLEIESSRDSERNVVLTFQIVNKLDTELKLYVPEFDDICSYLVRVELLSSKGDTVRVLPCSEISDLDHYSIPQSRVSTIEAGDSLKSNFILPSKYFQRFDSKNELYRLRLIFNYEMDEFKNYNEGIFCQKLSSNWVNL